MTEHAQRKQREHFKREVGHAKRGKWPGRAGVQFLGRVIRIIQGRVALFDSLD